MRTPPCGAGKDLTRHASKKALPCINGRNLWGASQNSHLGLALTISAFLPSTAPSPYCGIGAKHQTIVRASFCSSFIPESWKNINLVQNIRELLRQDRANGLWPVNSTIFFYLRRRGRTTIPVCDKGPNLHLIVLDQVVPPLRTDIAKGYWEPPSVILKNVIGVSVCNNLLLRGYE